LILISIPTGIYSYVNSDSSTEGWVLTFMLFLFVGVGILYSTDRLLVKQINPKKLSLFEVVLTILSCTLLMYSSRQLSIDLGDSKQNFVIIIENNGQLSNTKSTAKSFFDNEIKSTENIIIVDGIPKDIRLNVRPNTWNGGHYYNRYSYDKYGEVILFSNPELKINEQISEAFIDSLIESEK
jgi:hypothetical protein